MLDTPVILQTRVQLTAVIRLTIPPEEMRKVVGPGLRELMGVVAAQKAGPAGSWFIQQFKRNPTVVDFEIGVPVTQPIVPIGRVKPSQLPAVKLARTVYHGAYEGIVAAWGEFDAWIQAQGHEPAGNLWDVYVAGPESGSDPSQWRTQLNRPLIEGNS